MIFSNKKALVFLLFFGFVFNFYGQKKTIDHTCYNRWKKLSNPSVSNDGKWIVYEINPYKGDGVVYWYNTATHQVDSVERGKNARFSYNNQFIYCNIIPFYEDIRTLKLSGVSKDKLPKDSLAIINLAYSSVKKIANLKQFKTAKKGDWIAYTTTQTIIDSRDFKKKRKVIKKKIGKYSSKGNVLTVYNPLTKKSYQWQYVKEFELSKNGDWIAFVRHFKLEENGKDSLYLNLFSLKTGEKIVLSTYKSIDEMVWSEDEKHFAFLGSKDTVKTNKITSLYLYDLAAKKLSFIVDSNYQGISAKNAVSENAQLYVSKNGDYLYFGTAEQRDLYPQKDTLLKTEKPIVDVWHWKDHQLQPRQLVKLDKKKKRTFLSRIDIATGKIHIYESDTLAVRTEKTGKSANTLAYSKEAYERYYDYSFPWKQDVYQLNLNTDSLKILLHGMGYNVSISPNGKGVVYFDIEKENYIYQNLSTSKKVCLSCNLDEEWFQDKNGQPNTGWPYSIVGWVKGGQDVLIQSRYDLFLLKLDGTKKTRITVGEGKEENQVMRWVPWNEDSLYIDLSRGWITGFNKLTKFSSIYQLNMDDKRNVSLKKLYTAYAKIYDIQKAAKADQVIFRQSTLQDYPEVWSTNTKFEKPLEISETNPQQKNYNWANVQLVKWRTKTGEKLQGLLYTPENLDKTKKHPLLVYFYELYSDRIHHYYAPKPTASIIYPTEYASAGYVVFIPDIRYREGHPGQSAYDCIMSGVDHVLRKFDYIDGKRMGLQGQSWGGYETAQLITMTNRFKAAMAGAPVANMFSAYGGIRWNSGLSRQFQYERTQSRIGGSIWEAPELFVENSPIFRLPEVATPLLIMHNDDDGSVPWYQGIELFMGLRRLNKPVWLLNYNGDEHNLMKPANRMDLSIRMRQFFDHFLLNKPAPEWLIKGIPAIKKGKDLGYDLIKK